MADLFNLILDTTDDCILNLGDTDYRFRDITSALEFNQWTVTKRSDGIVAKKPGEDGFFLMVENWDGNGKPHWETRRIL